MAVELIAKGVPSSHPCFSIVKAIRQMINQPWNVHVTHSFREANRAADWLASYAFNFPLGVHQLHSPPRGIVSILRDDVVGVAFYRNSSL
ncbi:Reverse transcriptase-like [Sesbania bispinosa]|nr:Reverse transcriptase-like [Sesbania bispinosa]